MPHRHLLAFATFLLLASSASARPKIIEGATVDATPGTTAGDAQLPADPRAAPGEPPAPGPQASGGPATGQPPVIWNMPQIQEQLLRMRLTTAALFKARKFAEAETVCRQAVQLIPHDPAGHFFLACALSQLDKKEEAFASLNKAVELGFNRPELIDREPSLVPLRGDNRFALAVAGAHSAPERTNPWQRKLQPNRPTDTDPAIDVNTENTGWEGRLGVFVSLYEVPVGYWQNEARKLPGRPDQELGRKLNAWYQAGTAAGNRGDLYDNHDGGHSGVEVRLFPQLVASRYDAEAVRRQFHTGLQNRFFFNGITFGNSSTALVNGPYWRSQPRLAYVHPREVALLYTQYTRHHVYVYPEHADHDGNDLYPANTPYLFITQGSSGSDRPVMHALAYTLASFRPDVKNFLAKNEALMPTIQMLFRSHYRAVKEPADYLTGQAHPAVFEGDGFDVGKIMDTAQAITADIVPPLARLKVVEDDLSLAGKQYFDPGPRQMGLHGQEIFTTPAAIARIHRTSNYAYRMTVSAEDSKDLTGRPLKYHWKVLRGDAALIKINPQNAAGSVVDLVVPFHPQRPVAPGNALVSNRVDIGCFVHNGSYYSAPAFVTFYTLANERRGYYEGDQVAWIEYRDHTSKGDYTDPMLDVGKTWKDSYHYDKRDRLTGWTRTRGTAQEEFTSDGYLVVEKDAQGRAVTARNVTYAATVPDGRTPQTLRQITGPELVYYEYTSPEDRVGRIFKRENKPEEPKP